MLQFTVRVWKRCFMTIASIRPESEFNVGAVSGAGARRLPQLLPGTAKEMARTTGVGYSQAKLTSDATYNATLGSAYLSSQLDQLGGSYVLPSPATMLARAGRANRSPATAIRAASRSSTGSSASPSRRRGTKCSG